MNIKYSLSFCLLISFTCSLAQKMRSSDTLSHSVKRQIEKLSESLMEAERNDDLKTFLAIYDKDAISMPEYQPTLQGTDEIETYYKEIFQRQDIKISQRAADEMINLGKMVVEIGRFEKQYADPKTNALVKQRGKYWHVWRVHPDGTIKLKGQSFGFFHPMEHPGDLVVELKQNDPEGNDIRLSKNVSFELKAYNALMEKGVRNRDGILRSAFFTHDGSFMPFADSTVTGMEKIKPYLLAYSSRGQVTIDSIACYTYHSEYFEDYVLEYPEFRVRWSTPQSSGRTEGKGIRIWKRQEDKSLRLYREIGTHNHLK